MKRGRDYEAAETLNLANCLLLLSHVQERESQNIAEPMEFECKTCNRKFSSFQALGGHRASHKRPKLEGEDLKSQAKFLGLGNKPKMHECSICGLEFPLGQALGGHMRKHRAAIQDGFPSINQVVENVPVLKRSNSTRISCLDLNLTPLENDLKLLFGNMAPKTDVFV